MSANFWRFIIRPAAIGWLVFMAGVTPAWAQMSFTKADNTTTLDQAGSWTPAGVPTASDTASWNGAYENGAVGVGAGLSIQKIQLISPSTAIAITTGAGGMTIGPGGIDMSASTQNLTINTAVSLGASQTWTINGTKSLTVNGAIGDAGQGFGLNLAGNGTVVLSGSNTFVGDTVINTGTVLNISSTGAMKSGITVGVSTGSSAANLINNGTIVAAVSIAAGIRNGTVSPASPNANELGLIATGYVQLNGGSSTGAITNNGQLTLSGSAQILSIGLISGSGGLGGINDNNTYSGGKTLVFSDGAALSYFKPANGTLSTLKVQGNGSASLAYFGYNSALNISYVTTFDGGTWTLGKLGRANSGAQFAGTANIGAGARVILQTPGFEHGNWNIKNGSLTANGTIAEGQGPTSHNIGLNVSVDSSGGAPGALSAVGLTLGLGAANTGAESNSLNIGSGGTVSFTSGNLTVGTALNHAAPESNAVTLTGGKLVIAGTFQSASTIGANQTRAFFWSGGQLTASTIVASSGFNGGNGSLTSSGLNQTAGVLAPGDVGTAGRTVIAGNYMLGANGTLAMEIGGATQSSSFQSANSSYDYLSVNGTASLAGCLNLSVNPGYTPAGAATYTILSSTGELTGAFANAPFGSRIVTTDGLSSFVISQVGKTVTLGQYLPVTPPTVTAALSPATVRMGGNASFRITSDSVVPVTYQWRKDGIAISGATSASLNLYSTRTSDSGVYDVVVTNSAGSTTSSLFTLTVTLPRSTDGVVVDAGSAQRFDATPQASSYSWQLDGWDVGSNSASYTYSPDVNAVGTHRLTVTETYSDNSSYTREWGVRVRISQIASSLKYYVSPNGSDSGDGSAGSPFSTLEKARDKIRTLPRPLPSGGVTVYLRGGTYYRSASFALNTTDSGSAGAPVTYMAYPGETPVISGGKPIPGSQFAPLASSEVSRIAPGVDSARIWEADLSTLGIVHKGPFPNTFGEWEIYNALASSSSGGLCELFYNGKRMYLSRYPNHDLTNDKLTSNLRMNGVVAGTLTVNGTQTTGYLNTPGNYTDSNGNIVPVGGAFQFNSSDASHVARWQTAMSKGGVWVAGYWRVPWQINGAKVGILDTGFKQVIGLANGVNISNGIGYKYSRPVGSKAEPYWVLNLLEELDQPGEWCIDFSRGKLYFLMDSAGSPPDNSVVLSDLGSALVQITGSYVSIQGIAFEYGLAQGVQVTGGSRNLVTGCTFRNMGGYSVEFNNVSGGAYNGVVSCNMSELASGGVLVRGGNSTQVPRIPTNNFVVNNKITDYARVVRVYAASVDVGFQYTGTSVGVRVAHNTASGSPHVGMLWKNFDHTIEYNDFSDYCQFSDDMGGIYTFASNYISNTVIRYNSVHHSDHGDGIYFDSDHINATVYGNVANLHTLGSEARGYGFFDQVPSGLATTGIPRTDTSYNNISVNSRYGFQFYSEAGGKIECNLSYNNVTPFRWNQIGINSTTGNYSNTTSNGTALGSGPNLSYSTDPGFMNFSGEDLRLRPDSKAYTDMPGFQSIPLEIAGIYNDEFRSDAKVWTPFVMTDFASGLGSNVATLNGLLVYPQFDANTLVKLYWGTTDGGADPAAWQNVEDLGTPQPGSVSKNLTALTPGTQYFYRYFASNSAGSMWAEQTNVLTTYPVASSPAGGTALADSFFTSASNAFDGDRATAWQSESGHATGWIQYQIANGTSVVVTQYAITSAADFPGRDPMDWEFLGSDDGATWTVLDTQTAQAFTSRGQTKTYGFWNSRPYKFYRLNITANNGDSSGLKLAELQLISPDLTPDTLGPVISTPGPITAVATSSSGAYLDFAITAIDAVSGVVTPGINPASGSFFPIGSTTVNVSATDTAGNTSNASFVVTVTPPTVPSPWTLRNVGTYNSPGSAIYSAGSLTINATGGTSGITGDIWTGTNDNFTYVSQPWSGDGIFTARLASFSASDTSAKAGLMLRETTNVGSKYGFTYLLKKGDAWSQHKTATNGSSGTSFPTSSATGKGIPYWVRLIRKGDVFTSYVSSNGTAWTQLGNATTNVLAGTALTVGFAVGPRTATGSAVATFDNVTFLGVPPPPSGLAAMPGSGQVALSWGAVPAADTYTVARGDTSGGPYAVLASGLSAQSFTDTYLPGGTTAYYVVTATNAAGESLPSGEILATAFTALQAWRYASFGLTDSSGSAADSADPDGDAIPNLVEYATGRNPKRADTAGVVAAGVLNDSLQIRFNRIGDPAITYRVEASSELVSGTWTEIWESTGLSNTSGSISVSDTRPVSIASPPRRFLRLRVTSP